MRLWLVKLRGLADAVEVEAEHRGAARHYAKCVADGFHRKGAIYRAVEWARLKRP